MVGGEGPDEEAPVRREDAARLGERARTAFPERVHHEAHRHGVEPGLAEWQVVGLAELEGGSAYAALTRLGEHGLRDRARRPTP